MLAQYNLKRNPILYKSHSNSQNNSKQPCMVFRCKELAVLLWGFFQTWSWEVAEQTLLP